MQWRASQWENIFLGKRLGLAYHLKEKGGNRKTRTKKPIFMGKDSGMSEWGEHGLTHVASVFTWLWFPARVPRIRAVPFSALLVPCRGTSHSSTPWSLWLHPPSCTCCKYAEEPRGLGGSEFFATAPNLGLESVLSLRTLLGNSASKPLWRPPSVLRPRCRGAWGPWCLFSSFVLLTNHWRLSGCH